LVRSRKLSRRARVGDFHVTVEIKGEPQEAEACILVAALDLEPFVERRAGTRRN